MKLIRSRIAWAVALFWWGIPVPVADGVNGSTLLFYLGSLKLRSRAFLTL